MMLWLAHTYVDQAEDEYFGEDWMDHFAASQILDAKYERVSIDNVVDQQAHLTEAQ